MNTNQNVVEVNVEEDFVVEAAKIVVPARGKEVFLKTKVGFLTPNQVVEKFYYDNMGLLSGKAVPEATATHPEVLELVKERRLAKESTLENLKIKFMAHRI